MPFVQEAAPAVELTPATSIGQVTTEPTAVAPAPQTTPADSAAPPNPNDSTTADPQASTPTTAAPVEAPKSTTTVDPEEKQEAKSDAKTESIVDTKPSITITKSETVTTPLAPKAPNDAIWLFTWLPLVVMMGLWLYLRGRNQAAERARAEALLAASSKKAKKATRGPSIVSDAANVSDQVSSERAKGNSKKNKKDKQQQKKKQQQANSAATTSKATAVTTAASATAPVATTTAAKTESVKPISAVATETTLEATTQTSMAANSAGRKLAGPELQPAKAIFEPLRKVTVSAPKVDVASDMDGDEDEEQEFKPSRKRRPNPPPVVVTAPAKVSSGRFEKLNLPPANAGLSASSANRWPAEAVQSVTPVRVPQPNSAPRANATSQVANAKSAASAPITGRGLAAFVKLAKPSNSDASPESAETQAESSST